MALSFPFRTTLWVGPFLAMTGCSCNDYDIRPFEGYPELENDHGQWLSMDVAPGNRLVVSYYDRTFGALGFAVGEPIDGGKVGWLYEQVDGYPDDNGLNPGTVGEFCSLKVAGDGSVWVSYYSRSNGALKVAHRVREQWTTEMVDTGSGLTPASGQWTSLDLNADDQPVVAYHDAAKGTLNLATRIEDGTWSLETLLEGEPWSGVDEAGEPLTRDANVGQFARLEISDNSQTIAFYDAAQQTLNLLEGPSGALTHSVIDDSANVGQWPSLSRDGDTFTLAYHDVTNQDLKLATRTGGGSFTLTTVDEGEYVGADTEVFLRDGLVNVLYFDGRTNDMKLAKDNGTEWDIQTLAGDTEAVGFHNEIVEDANGYWWAASYNYTTRKIFAQRLE